MIINVKKNYLNIKNYKLISLLILQISKRCYMNLKSVILFFAIFSMLLSCEKSGNKTKDIKTMTAVEIAKDYLKYEEAMMDKFDYESFSNENFYWEAGVSYVDYEDINHDIYKYFQHESKPHSGYDNKNNGRYGEKIVDINDEFKTKYTEKFMDEKFTNDFLFAINAVRSVVQKKWEEKLEKYMKAHPKLVKKR